MSLIQVTYLKIHIGTNGKYLHNLHLETGRKQDCFLCDAITEVGVGGEKGGKPCEDLSKNFKAWAPE